MSTIVFIVYPAPSHHNATLKLARRLQANGHHVVYVVHEAFREWIEAQQFACYVLRKKVLPSPFKKHLHRQDHQRAFIADFKEGTFFDDMVDELKPDLILLDFPFLPYAVFLQRFGVAIISLQTMVCLQKDRLIPPVNQTTVPKSTWWSYLRIEASWLAYFLTRWLTDRQQEYRYGESETSLLRKAVAQSAHFTTADIDTNVYLHYGLTTYPQLQFSPREFDFPRANQHNLHYLGSVVDLSRQEPVAARYSNNVVALLADLEAKKRANPAHQVVFCSLGANNHLHYAGCPAFFAKLITVFEAMPHTDLVLAVGVKTPLDQFRVRTANIHLFAAVPQLEVLPLASLMITHGGMNSLTECIYFGVPVVVYPLSTDLDQKGNAARAVYHGLGVQGNIRRDGTAQIASRTAQVLGNPAFRERIAHMGQAVRDSTDFETGVQFIESRLPANTNTLLAADAIPQSGTP
ncbi:glycosyltransferase [Fibrella aquatilis]|uniref:Glycosyltransferase family 1 protein n=1 Tax=Fibrella aquatilis TaxID=2817059 RepID=A0A939GAC2_9BACT|nr:glycosyltransferase [Fibrella aquatilis]MBO0933584.1 glycosyltransferase family 1 protein [Fibrella aquatilis]